MAAEPLVFSEVVTQERSRCTQGGGIPQTVGLATKVNNESKPVWLCVQAFEAGRWLMPTVREMRGQVYAGIIHGATGIIYL